MAADRGHTPMTARVRGSDHSWAAQFRVDSRRLSREVIALKDPGALGPSPSVWG
jgi:hypothetical protein